MASSPNISLDQWYTAKEAEGLLGVSRDTIKRYLRKGKVDGKQIGPHQEWHIQGQSIQRVRENWGLSPLPISEKAG